MKTETCYIVSVFAMAIGLVCHARTLDLTGQEEIEKNAYLSDNSITKLVVGNNTYISEGAFRNCYYLSDVTIGSGSSVHGTLYLKTGTFIGPFTGCPNITMLRVPCWGGAYGTSIDWEGTGLHKWFPSSWRYFRNVRLHSGFSILPNGYFADMEDLVSVGIPNGVKELGRYAFSNCRSLPSIWLPSSLQTIGPHCFEWCSSLGSIRVPNGVTSIGEDAFYDCTSLREATLSSSLRTLGDRAFANCSLLADIVVPSGVTSIGQSAFNGCSQLRSVSLPDELSSLGAWLFGDCENLRWVNIPSSTRTIGDGAFYGCRSLIQADLPDGLESVGDSAFFQCRLLRNVFLPSTLSEIGDSAFEGCMGIREMEIPENVSSIGYRAFADCTGLSYLALPPDTTMIGDDLFDGCTRLETVVLPWFLRGNTDWLGIPEGCDVLFYDDANIVSLSEVGANPLRPFTTVKRFCRAGTVLDRSVPGIVTNAATPGVRRVCTGWTGAGDVPASGTFPGNPTDVSVSVPMSQNSRLRWEWRTDVRIDLDVEGGSCDFSAGWVEQGQTVDVRLFPDEEVFDVVLEGETDGVVVNGARVSFLADVPRRLSIRMRPRPDFALSVSSAHGAPTPAAGTMRFYRDQTVAAFVAEPEPMNGVAFVCTGWRGTGSVPSAGSSTNVAFSVTQDSSLEWLWATNVWIGLELSGPVVTDEPVWGWRRIGSSVVAHYDPAVDYATYELSGDTNGVAWDRAERTITIPCDAPRSLRLKANEHTLSTALDSIGFQWFVYGSSPWYPQVEESSDGVDALRSGDVSGGGCILETAVQGPGTLSWKWKLDASGAGTAGIDLLVDDDWLDSLEEASGWTSFSVDIVGTGRHTVRFDFWNAGDDRARGYLDAVAWTGASCATTNTPVPVPFDWIDGRGLAPRGDYERVAEERSACGRPVWECYVAGLDPEDPDADFRAGIVVSNGVPVVTFYPDLGNERVYVVEGKENLSDPWGPTNANTRFFRVKVGLKEKE